MVLLRGGTATFSSDPMASHLKIIQGNLFRSTCQTLVNTVNCVGVMGAGLAFECRLRYPQMHEHYLALCQQGKLDIGLLWLCKSTTPWVLNFPTKRHWKYPTKPEYLHQGLQKFMATYQERGVTSVAFPLLGAQNGGLTAEQSLGLMTSYLERCSIPVEIYRHDPTAADDCYDRFKAVVQSMADDEIRARTGLRADAIARVRDALGDARICQLNQLVQVPRIGEKTLEKCFALAMGRAGAGPAQVALGL